jgi:hypothetical protein
MAAVAVSCDDVPTQAQASVGVSAERDAGLTVHIALCNEERVRRISLVDTRGDNPGASSNETLWEITSATGVEVDAVPVGSVPQGFSGSVKDVQLREGTTYAIVVDTTEVTSVSVAFSRGRVDDFVLTGDGAKLSKRDFVHHGKEICG